MLLPEVEELIAKAAEWGHKAVAITDHGNVQSFLHGFKAANKAGIQLMKANIVEDKVPITYNEVDLTLSMKCDLCGLFLTWKQ